MGDGIKIASMVLMNAQSSQNSTMTYVKRKGEASYMDQIHVNNRWLLTFTALAVSSLNGGTTPIQAAPSEIANRMHVPTTIGSFASGGKMKHGFSRAFNCKASNNMPEQIHWTAS